VRWRCVRAGCAVGLDGLHPTAAACRAHDATGREGPERVGPCCTSATTVCTAATRVVGLAKRSRSVSAAWMAPPSCTQPAAVEISVLWETTGSQAAALRVRNGDTSGRGPQVRRLTWRSSARRAASVGAIRLCCSSSMGRLPGCRLHRPSAVDVFITHACPPPPPPPSVSDLLG
jgi:hypothetical protein